MKSPIVSIRTWSFAACVALGSHASAQGIAGVASDAALIAAIEANKIALKDELGKEVALQTATLAQNVLISGYLSNIHEYEKKYYNYVSEAQGIVTEAFTIKKCIDLGSEIVNALGDCRKAAFEHPDAVLCAELVNGSLSDVIQESAALVSYLKPIVQSDGDNNLLNSAERIRILNNVHSRLYALCCDIHSLHYNIMCSRWGYVAKSISDDIFQNWLNEKDVYQNHSDYIKGLIKGLN